MAIEGTLKVVVEDPDDDHFVESAVTAGPEYRVSGDRHLKKIETHDDIRIVASAEFLRLFTDRQAFRGK